MDECVETAAPLSDADKHAIRDGLRAFNRRHSPAPDPVPVELAVRADNGEVCGGLLGETRWQWLVIHTLWVADEHRRRGHGTRLMAEAEAIARARGCRFAALDTTGFQAVDFYKARGYEPFGRLVDYPPGSWTIYLRKSLDVRSDASPGNTT
jgi:ribosomal protein S18 acetylase RimI-like enzyme